MRRMLRLQRVFIAQYLKQLMEYKGDFLIGVLAVLLMQGLNILFLNIIFSQIPALAGWSFKQIIFIYGFALIPKGIDHLLFDNLWALGQNVIRMGDFDKYLTRPLNPLFHIVIETFQLDALGELIIGISLLVSSASIVDWDPLKIMLLIVAIPFATIIYTSLKIATASIAFWTKQSGAITFIFYMINDFAKYPTTIYNIAIKFVITFIVPFAFTAFYPASFFLTGKDVLFNIGGLILLAIILLDIALFIWRKGLGAYESAGS